MARRISHVIGFDDAPFPRNYRGDVLLVGAVYAGPRLEGVLSDKVRRDGINATRTIVRLVSKSHYREHLQAVLLQGITFAGFNVVDLQAADARLPVARQDRHLLALGERHRADEAGVVEEHSAGAEQEEAEVEEQEPEGGGAVLDPPDGALSDLLRPVAEAPQSVDRRAGAEALGNGRRELGLRLRPGAQPGLRPRPEADAANVWYRVAASWNLSHVQHSIRFSAPHAQR